MSPARSATLTALVFVVVLLGIDMFVALAHPDLHGDTAGLTRGAQGVVDCLSNHRFTRCDTVAHGPKYVGQWPLMQYIPATALRAVGASQDFTLRVLVFVEALAVDATVVLAWFVVRRTASAMWALVIVASLLASPLLWYETSAFGEALAAFVVLLAICAVLRNAQPWIIAVLIAAACITKETSPPFVFVLAVLCVLACVEAAHRRRAIIAIAVGAVVGYALNSAFNLFRYGKISNSNYTRSLLRVPDRRTAARFFGAVWASPSGGLFWYWTAAVVIVAFVALVSLWRALSTRRMSWQFAAGPLIAIMLVVEVGGLAQWYSPFGWIAWGPRLTLPLMPAMLVAAAACSQTITTEPLRRFLRSAWFWLVTAVLTVLAIPQASVLFQRHVLEDFFAPTGVCVRAHINESVARYYRCVDYLMWHKRPLLLQDGLGGLKTVGGWLATVALAGAIVSLLVAARSYASRPHCAGVDDRLDAMEIPTS